MTSQMVRGNVPMQQMAPQPILPGDQDALIRTLNDVNQRDDVKLKAVQDAWSKFDAFSVTPTFDQFLDSLMRAFLKLFSETVPQFIVENNTQMLRKAMLEMILRTSAHEPVKNLSKEIQKQMMRIIVLENEENAILAIKIVVDHSKIARSHLIPEVSVMLQNFKQWVKCMCVTLSRSHTFDTIDLTHPSVQLPEEAMIETYLQQCYYTQSALLYSPNGTLDTLYNLIPRASQSLKAFQDIPMLVIFLYQHHKSGVQTEAMEFLLCCLDFLSIQISNEQKADEKYNKALADEFYTAQSKMLAYLSIMGKIREFMDQILANGDRFVNGVLALLEQCPAELIVVRKDVLITLKFFFISDLRPKFIQLLPRLLSELALIGSGYTAVDHLRGYFYQTMADFLHHVRSSLSFEMLAHVAFIFCREMHDNLLPYQIQVICARMLSSVLEGLTKHAKEGEANRDLILMILESLVVKMKVLAVYHMPLLFKQHGAEINYDYKSCDRDGSDNAEDDKGSDDVIREEVRRCSIDTAPEMEIGPADPLQPPSPSLPVPKENGTHKQSSPGSILTQMYAMNAPPIPLVEARTIVKFILLACKMGTSALSGANRSAQSPPLVRERDIFERMFKYCVQCLDVFMIPFPQPPSRVQVPNSVPGGTRSKEEKDALDALAYLFTMLNLDVFGEIFTKYMDFFVVRMAKNLPLQLACNAFLVRADVSFRFGCIIVKYLMDRLPCLAVMNDVSTLYVKLFKIIFSAIGCQNSASPDGEIMLKPYLPELIRKSMEYALSARDPINYFMLLRALFRSIGGGLHDILYSQFLPLLPDLMLFFNKLQWCDHRQMMRELFVELCLTVPVRLSTLLPHLPLLMEPLVCALNGGPNLVQQGLRTLELCVDNLQPDFLFDNFSPVRGGMMQGLYKIVGKSVEPQSVATAVRVLGKFGGANRNMFTEPPSLKSHPKGDQPPFTIRVAFDRPNTSQTFFSTIYGDLALTEIVRTALKQIRLDPSHQHYSTQVRQYAMELARSVLLSSFAPLDFSEKWEVGLKDRFVEQFKRLENAPDSCTVLRCAREGDRAIHSDALMILFCGIVGKDLRSKYIKFFNASIRYLTLQALLEFTGRAALMSLDHPAQCMDGGILVDAIVTALSDSTKDFCQSAIVGLRHINDVCRAVIPNLEVMPRIPFVRYLIESVSALCYASSWFVRLGGASGLMYFIENYPDSVVLTNMNGFMESLVEVLVGMTDQVSCGAVDMAVGAIEKLQKRCLTGCHVNDPKVSLFMNCVANHLFSGNQHVRQKTLAMLNTCAEVLTISLSTLLFNYREVFLAQIDRAMNEFNVLALLDRCGCLEALCTIFKCQPPLVDISIESERIQNFAKELISVCQMPVSQMLELELFKSMDGCPAHFLPPYTVSEKAEYYKILATRALVTLYKALILQAENGTSQKMDTSTSTIDVQVRSETLEKIACVAIETVLCPIPSVVKAAEEALMQISPVDAKCVKTVGEPVFDLFRGSQGKNRNSGTVAQLYRLIRLNTSLFDVTLATNLVNYICGHVTRYPLGSSPTSTPPLDGQDVEAITQTVRLLLLVDDPSGAKLATDIAAFISYFDHHYCTSAYDAWIPPLATLLSRYARESMAFFLSEESLSMPCRRALLRKLIKDEECAPIRSLLMQDSSYFVNLLENRVMDVSGEWREPSPAQQNESGIMEREMLCLHIIDAVSRRNVQWFADAKDLIIKLRQLWNNADFKGRYVVHAPCSKDLQELTIKMMTEHKYKVPRLLVNCFVRHYRHNNNDLDLLCDILFVFIGRYVTDFCFVREFLEREVIPTYSMEWRRKLFSYVLGKFEAGGSTVIKDLLYVKIVQYVLIPSLQWAFERYNVDEILGEIQNPSEQPENDPNDLVYRLAHIIDQNRQVMSDGIVIVLYQLCTLLVKHAPRHVHNNDSKKHGWRLRVFMLFAWSCLTPTNRQDATLRYTGFLFISHIVQKFTINRKIVLQVFQALCGSFQYDSRELVRRAADVVTAAMPIRMDDGHHQMFINVKRVLCEEAHSLQHIQHIVSMVVRNYRSYFSCRHALFKPLMNAVRRVISTPNSAMDGVMTRKLALDMCEMVIKWELLRLQKVEQLTQGLTSHDDEFESLLNDQDRQAGPSSSNIPTSNAGGDFDDQLYKQMSKECADEVVAMLLKFAIQPTTGVQPHQLHQATVENGKRSIGLMKQCLKSQVWGDIVTIKVGWLEKELTVPPESLVRQENQAQFAQSISQSQQALEVVINLVTIMPKPLLLQTVRPLQRAIISCLNCGHSTLVRLVNMLVSKLFEKSNCSMTGMYEFEILNQFISKYLNDHFNSYVKSSACMIMNAFTALSLLRVICTQQPGYLDAMCLQAYIKVLEKAVREHIGHITEQGEATREKVATAEMIAMALEMLRPRVEAISAEAKRTICQNVLLPLIERSTFDKIIDVVLRVVSELVVTHRDENCANPGLPLLVRLQSVVEKRYRANSDLMKMFLKVVLFVFEHPLLLTSDYAEKLEDAFHWGLTAQDREMREKFLLVFERNLAVNPIARLTYILRDKNWEPFRDYFWLRHVLWLLLRCIPASVSSAAGHRRIFIDSSATLWRTMHAVAGFRPSSLGSELETDVHAISSSLYTTKIGTDSKADEEVPMETDQEGASGDSNMSTRMDEYLEDQKSLLIEAASFDFSAAVDCIVGLVFTVQDDIGFISDMFSHLFHSLWISMSEEERSYIGGLAVPFMTAGGHVQQAHAVHPVINILLETFSHCNPPIPIDANAIQFISHHYHSWHRGILLLESRALCIPPMLNSPECLQQGSGMNVQENLDVLNCLGMLYSELAEQDQYAAVWNRRAVTIDSVKILAMQQLGDIEEALNYGQAAASAMLQRLESQYGRTSITEANLQEYEFFDSAYIQCTKELCRWKEVCDIARNSHVENLELLFESSVHLPDWSLAKQCRDQIVGCYRSDFVIPAITYGAMLAVLGDPEDVPTTHPKKMVEEVTQALVVGWRVLPPILTSAHTKLLQQMTMIREVGDVLDLKRALDAGNQNCGAVMQEMKTVIKIWRSRTYSSSDDMSFISLMYDWRSQIHAMMVQQFHEWERSGIVMPPGMNPQSILPIHSAATGQLFLARAARERGMDRLAIRTLNKLHTLITLPMMDCHQKIIDHLKTLRRMAKRHTTTPQQKLEFLQEALLITRAARIEDFSRDQCCRLFYQKGAIFSQLEKNEDAMHAFATAATMVDPSSSPQLNTACSMFKTWAHHLDNLFFSEKHEASALSRGLSAINCYIEAARVENETRARKYIARILWTAKHVVASGIYAAAGLDNLLKERSRSIVPFNWLPWLPQLMTELQERPTSGFTSIVQRIAAAYPSQIVSALRPLLDPVLIDEVIEAVAMDLPVPSFPDDHKFAALCEVLEKACRTRVTDVRMWNRLLSGFSSMREFWAERHLRYASQLKDEILRCLYNARETRLETASLDQRALTALSEWCTELKRINFDDIIHEHEVPSSSRHALPLQTEDQFIDEFRAEVLEMLEVAPLPVGSTLLKLAESVIKWQTKLHNRLYSLPRRYPIRLSSKFLADYSSAMACIEIPSSFNANMTKQYQYVTLIARFNPYVEVVVKGGRVMKRLQIMAVNGKTCVYYLQRSVFEEKTNRCQQYLQIVKTLLVKERETARRHLSIFTPTQLCVSPHALLLDCGGAYPMSLVAKKPHIFDVIRPLDVFARYGMTFGMRPDDAITMFYDRLVAPEGSPQTVMLETYRGFVVDNFIGPSILKNYVLERFTDATYYYLFRKRVAQQLAVLSVLEMLVRMSPLFLEDLSIRTSTAQLATPRYKFAIDEDCERTVPFRLTPNFQWFLGMTIEGDFLWAAAAAIRCLFRRDQHLLLRPLILDEIVSKGNHDQTIACAEASSFIEKVTAETARMATQEASLLQEEIQLAIESARNEGNLSQMDPRWHPWF